MYKNSEVSSEDDLYFLRLFSEYDHTAKQSVQMKFEKTKIQDQERLTKTLGLEVLKKDDDEIKKIIELKKWAVRNLSFKGEMIKTREFDYLDCLEIIEKAKSNGNALNCRYITLVFTQILLTMGFKARLICCMSMDLRDTECHWVTEVYINQLRKWIVVDIPLDFFYFDAKGNLLNLIEMRRMIVKGENIRLISTNREHILFTQQYWRKNIFRFKFLEINKYNMLMSENKHYLVLNPKGFIMQNKKRINEKNHVIQISYYYDERLFWEGASYV